MKKQDELLGLFEKCDLSRRAFLKTCGSLAVLMGLPFQIKEVFAASPGASATPDHITLTWAGDPTTTQTITWRTDATVNGGVIQYTQINQSGKAILASLKTVTAAIETLKSNLGDMNLHSVTLTGLLPGTTFTYRVGDGSNWSTNATFATANLKTNCFKFLIFGDSQAGIATVSSPIGAAVDPGYQPWQTTVANAFQANPDARFLVNVGDLVEAGQDYNHWNNWYLAAQGVIETIPVMPVQGNHETYNAGWTAPDGSTTEPYEWVQQFKLPQNGPTGLKGQCYSWDYGNVHFSVVDSQYDEEVMEEKGYGRFSGKLSTPANPMGNSFLSSQVTWLDNDLKSTQKLFKVVFFHKTPYYNKLNRSNEIIKAAFTPIIDKYHVDVVFNGHDHGISRTYPINNDSFVNSPSDGTVYYVTGRSGNKYYTDLSQKVWDAFFYDSVATPTYIVAQVDGSSLTLKAYTQNGTLLDRYTVDKSTSDDNPLTVLPAKYTNTQVVIFGSVALYQSSALNALQQGSTWYVPLSFVTVPNIGATSYNYNADTGQVTFKLSSVHYTFTIGSTIVGGSSVSLVMPIITQDGIPMIAADDAKKLWSYSYQYNAEFNMLYIVR